LLSKNSKTAYLLQSNTKEQFKADLGKICLQGEGKSRVETRNEKHLFTYTSIREGGKWILAANVPLRGEEVFEFDLETQVARHRIENKSKEVWLGEFQILLKNLIDLVLIRESKEKEASWVCLENSPKDSSLPMQCKSNLGGELSYWHGPGSEENKVFIHYRKGENFLSLEGAHLGVPAKAHFQVLEVKLWQHLSPSFNLSAMPATPPDAKAKIFLKSCEE